MWNQIKWLQNTDIDIQYLLQCNMLTEFLKSSNPFVKIIEPDYVKFSKKQKCKFYGSLK